VKGASVISLVMTIIAPLLRVLITLIVCVSYFHRVKSSRQAQGPRVCGVWSLAAQRPQNLEAELRMPGIVTMRFSRCFHIAGGEPGSEEGMVESQRPG
jgi:hypothetical protein